MRNQESTFKNCLALVVDDDMVARTVAIQTMSQLGFEVISADDGDTALEQLAEYNPDIILLDVEMERMDGIETCQQIRQFTAFGNKPIIMMTSHDDAESIDNAFQAGATDFAMKPVNWALLHHKIKYVMRSQEVLIELTNAEKISGMGNWRQDVNGGNVDASKGLKMLLGLELDKPVQLIDYVHPADRNLVSQELEQLGTKDKMSLTHRMITADNQEIIVQHRAQSLTSFNGESKGLLGTIHDITERESTNKKVQQLAFFDPVTQLFNRSATIDRLDILTMLTSHLRCFMLISITSNASTIPLAQL